MKIETEYDIGQEVWSIMQVRYMYIDDIAGALPYKIKIESLDVASNLEIYYYDEEAGNQYKESDIYPTKEACEQAIKEMEDDR